MNKFYKQRYKIIVVGTLLLTNIFTLAAFKSTEQSFKEQSKLIEQYQTKTEIQRSKIEELNDQLNAKISTLTLGVNDLENIKAHIMNNYELTNNQLVLYDVNDDGLVNSADYVIIKNQISRDILLTAYHTGDGSSGVTTASGLSTTDFQTNELGWYTYQDKVVLATSNTERMNLPLFDGYASHNINDTLDFELDGTIYQGIVLDVCGACYGVDGEAEQRYDIFTNGAGIGKKSGVIYE